MTEAAAAHNAEQHFVREVREELGPFILRLRLLFIPSMLGLMAWQLGSSPDRWRLLVLLALIVTMVPLALFLAYQSKRGFGFSLTFVHLNSAINLIAIASILVATGGVSGPLAPFVIPAAFLVALLGSGRMDFTALSWLGAPMLIAAIEYRWPSIALHEPASTEAILSRGAALFLAGAILYGVGRSLRTLLIRSYGRFEKERDEHLEAHRRAERELHALSGELAHELKNPLASLRGLNDLLRGEVSDAGERHREVMLGEIKRMQGVLEEFLNFSRPSTPLVREEADLRAVLREVAELHQGLARQAQVELIVDEGPAQPLAVDRRKLIQILINLLQNALEASPKGATVQLKLSAEASGITLCVLDEGPGLPAEIEARAFTPGVTTKAKGSGLGLAIARGLATQLQGRLELANRDGGGCEARVWLPRG